MIFIFKKEKERRNIGGDVCAHARAWAYTDPCTSVRNSNLARGKEKGAKQKEPLLQTSSLPNEPLVRWERRESLSLYFSLMLTVQIEYFFFHLVIFFSFLFKYQHVSGWLAKTRCLKLHDHSSTSYNFMLSPWINNALIWCFMSIVYV